MSSSVTFSVGVPAYNQGCYLARTLTSLLNQIVPADEIVVSDNFSTDETAEVVASFAGRIRLVRPPHHMSMMEHWNFVLSHLQGDWITLLSSDDIAKSNFVERLKRGTLRTDDAVLVRSGWETIDEEDRVTSKHHLLSVGAIERPPQTFYESLMGPKASFAAFAAKRQVLLDIGGFPDSCKLYGDWACWLRLSASGSFVYEDAIISQYRVGDRLAQMNSRLPLSLADYIQIATHIIPEMASAIPGVDRKRVERKRVAFLRNFLRDMDAAGERIFPSTREAALPLIKQWAEAVGTPDLYTKFITGQMKLDPNGPQAMLAQGKRAVRDACERWLK